MLKGHFWVSPFLRKLMQRGNNKLNCKTSPNMFLRHQICRAASTFPHDKAPMHLTAAQHFHQPARNRLYLLNFCLHNICQRFRSLNPKKPRFIILHIMLYFWEISKCSTPPQELQRRKSQQGFLNIHTSMPYNCSLQPDWQMQYWKLQIQNSCLATSGLHRIKYTRVLAKTHSV